jgi:hypothetical protein
MGRIFRAVNILKKDIKDIKYDLRHNMKTVIIIMSKNKKYDFSDYINKVVELYINKAEKINLSVARTNAKNKIPIVNYLKMIKQDKKEIIKLISKY